eukprot:CAMPEP_0119496976 /NCGR_PEP_ID=MMETSP1344-20130328/20156_1 /TAXON_ID=236787 /ORGANISM="Florenciella parvula, Strain CCMP2471" /LENGTH=198 /DNA_ID=CAMNT_0007532721 /DNA_START=23 /DNA_END=615 /DNA_ORIENTATION=-
MPASSTSATPPSTSNAERSREPRRPFGCSSTPPPRYHGTARARGGGGECGAGAGAAEFEAEAEAEAGRGSDLGSDLGSSHHRGGPGGFWADCGPSLPSDADDADDAGNGTVTGATGDGDEENADAGADADAGGKWPSCDGAPADVGVRPCKSVRVLGAGLGVEMIIGSTSVSAADAVSAAALAAVFAAVFTAPPSTSP